MFQLLIHYRFDVSSWKKLNYDCFSFISLRKEKYLNIFFHLCGCLCNCYYLFFFLVGKWQLDVIFSSINRQEHSLENQENCDGRTELVKKTSRRHEQKGKKRQERKIKAAWWVKRKKRPLAKGSNLWHGEQFPGPLEPRRLKLQILNAACFSLPKLVIISTPKSETAIRKQLLKANDI